MHRIPLTLDLTAIRGLEVIQISVGRREVIVKLHPSGAIRSEPERCDSCSIMHPGFNRFA